MLFIELTERLLEGNKNIPGKKIVVNTSKILSFSTCEDGTLVRVCIVGGQHFYTINTYQEIKDMLR